MREIKPCDAREGSPRQQDGRRRLHTLAPETGKKKKKKNRQHHHIIMDNKILIIIIILK